MVDAGNIARGLAEYRRQIDLNTKSLNKTIQKRDQIQKKANKTLEQSLKLQIQLANLGNGESEKKQPGKIDDLKTIKDLTIKILDAQISYAKSIQDTDRQLFNM